MLNLIIRATRLHRSPAPLATCIQSRLQLFASFTVRDVLHDTSDETGTLITRFAKHIAMEKYKFVSLPPVTIRYADYFPVHDVGHFKRELQKISADQLSPLIIFAFTYRSNGDPAKFVRVLNDIDDMCVARLADMDYDTVLSTLYSLLFLIPNKITRTDFYRAAVQRLVHEYSADFPKEKFVQVCFYLGLNKKISQELMKPFLNTHLQAYAADVSTMDMAVLTSAMYKTATPVSCKTYLERLELEALALPATDDALMVTCIKNLRLQRIRSDQICERLMLMCDPRILRKLQTSGLVHIFAYFAENRWDDDKNTKNIVYEFLRRVTETKKFQSFTDHGFVRAKDLSMFLWCCSQLNSKLGESELQCLERAVLDKVQNEEFRNFPDQLVDCCLSLWTIGLKSRSILQEAVNIKGKDKRTKMRDHSKVDNRLTVLQSAVAIEYPTWILSTDCFAENSPAPGYLLKNRSDLTKYAQQLSGELDVVSANIVCPIKGINVPGFMVEFNENLPKTFVELLEPEQLLRFSQEPVAILKLKISLLTALGYRVICLSADDLGAQYTCLKDFVLKETNAEKSLEQSVNSI